MATLYDNTNTFTLFKNDKGDNPKRPDYTGKMNVDGIGFKISGWIRHLEILVVLQVELSQHHKLLHHFHKHQSLLV